MFGSRSQYTICRHLMQSLFTVISACNSLLAHATALDWDRGRRHDNAWCDCCLQFSLHVICSSAHAVVGGLGLILWQTSCQCLIRLLFTVFSGYKFRRSTHTYPKRGRFLWLSEFRVSVVFREVRYEGFYCTMASKFRADSTTGGDVDVFSQRSSLTDRTL